MLLIIRFRRTGKKKPFTCSGIRRGRRPKGGYYEKEKENHGSSPAGRGFCMFPADGLRESRERGWKDKDHQRFLRSYQRILRGIQQAV